MICQGEHGANALKGPNKLENAEKEFCKKFKDKTRNDWSARDNFESVKGKYTLIEIESSSKDDRHAMEKKVLICHM